MCILDTSAYLKCEFDTPTQSFPKSAVEPVSLQNNLSQESEKKEKMVHNSQDSSQIGGGNTYQDRIGSCSKQIPSLSGYVKEVQGSVSSSQVWIQFKSWTDAQW